jgi:hypothetical protein
MAAMASWTFLSKQAETRALFRLRAFFWRTIHRCSLVRETAV